MISLLCIGLGCGILGTFFGSFCGVLMDEPVEERSFWTGRSECLNCHHTLTAIELIPIFSYFHQKGRCTKCHVQIPISVITIEVLTGLVWMVLGGLLWYAGASFGAFIVFFTCACMLIMLALVDFRTLMIPDRLSLPMIVIVAGILILNTYYPLSPFLPSLPGALLGAAGGMYFYLLQMMIPAILHTHKNHDTRSTLDVLLMLVVTPLWLITRICTSEATADRLFPSFATIDDLPVWVGGGDIRLGILAGLMLGPWYLACAIGIGYTAGSLFYVLRKVLFKKELTVLPVAPLVLFGTLAVWVFLFAS